MNETGSMQPPRKRPPALVVIAVLNLIFGGIGILVGACGFAFMGTQLGESFVELGKNQPGQVKGASWPEVQEEISVRAPAYTEITWTAMILDFLASLALIVSGIGLLRLRIWARNLTITYGVLQLLHTLAYSTYMLAVVMPLIAAVREEVMANAPVGFQRQVVTLGFDAGYLGNIVGTVCSPVYPVLVLVFMFLPSVRRAFQRPQAAAPASPVPSGS